MDTNNKPFVFEDNVTVEIIAKVEATHNTTLTEITLTDYEALIAPTLDELKAKKISELTQAYNTEIEADIAYMNTTFQADKYSQDMISKVLAVGSVPTGLYWVDTINNQVAMTYADLQGLAGAMLARGQVVFDKLQGLKAQVRSAVNETELNSIGW
jgi:hypothetical protein